MSQRVAHIIHIVFYTKAAKECTQKHRMYHFAQNNIVCLYINFILYFINILCYIY